MTTPTPPKLHASAESPSPEDWCIRKSFRPSSTLFVFIHGVLSASESAWTNEDTGAYWPKLVADHTVAGVGVAEFTYKTTVFTAGYSIDEVAGLLNLRLRQKVPRHIIFVCHSMGGLVARKFLVEHWDELRKQGVEKVLIELVASPSLGSAWASVARLLSTPLQQKQAQQLAKNNAWLMTLNRRFLKLKEKDWPDTIKVDALVEKAMLNLVDEHSAAF